MRKIGSMMTLVLLLTLIFTAGSQAQIISGAGYGLFDSSVFMPDWEMDYLRPLEPGTLSPGQYRLSFNAGRMTLEEDNYFSSDTSNTNNYFFGYDSAFENNNYLHLSLNYLPNFADTTANTNVINFKFTHQFQEENNVYIGVLRNHTDSYYDNNNNFREEETNSLYYVGVEYYGNFAK